MNEFDDRRHKDGAELDRRVLDAARREQPPAELSARMASVLGITALGATGPLGQSSAATEGSLHPKAGPEGNELGLRTTHDVASKGGAAPSAGSIWSGWVPWGAGAVAIGIAGAFVAQRSATTDRTIAPAIPTLSGFSRDVPPAPVPSSSAGPIERPTSRAPTQTTVDGLAVAPDEGTRSNEIKGDPRSSIHAEIAWMDRARSAMASGSYPRALDALREYTSTYPRGSFRPEAAALRIECLVKLGRLVEARSLARRFVATHRDSPLAERVTRLTGLEAH